MMLLTVTSDLCFYKSPVCSCCVLAVFVSCLTLRGETTNKLIPIYKCKDLRDFYQPYPARTSHFQGLSSTMQTPQNEKSYL